jgi:hypothetical protein
MRLASSRGIPKEPLTGRTFASPPSAPRPTGSRSPPGRASVGYVSREPYLFYGSVTETIACGLSDGFLDCAARAELPARGID